MCQELTGSERRFEALVNELVLIENKPAKVLGAGGQQYRSPKSHFMSLVKNSPNPRRPARPSEDDLDLEATIMDGMPLFDWLQKEEYGAAEAAPRPEEEAIECGCCCNSYSVEEMRPCDGDEVHLFCHNCIRSYCENQIGQSKYEMHCLSVNNCSALFSPSTLFNVLPASVFKNLMANQQAEEISAANIDDLETCPFCPFSIIFDSKVTVSSPNIVFRCDNPDCGKPSCRLCKKAAHSPAKCEEVRAQTDARTHLENEMTEAMVRECVQCRKRFIKQDGCNKMTCSCGAKMCYICKQPVTSYDHFDNNTPAISNKCPLYTPDLPGLHAKEVQDRADALKSSMDPNLLLYDPTSS